MYSEGMVFVTDRKITVGELDNSVSYLLTALHEKYNKNFSVKILKIVLTEENYNVHILIEPDFSFECFKIKPNEIFSEIKNHLIGKLPYNSFQKEVLAEVFRNKNSVTAVYNENRGIGIISKTVSLYFKNMGKKVLFVGKDIPDEIKHYGDISEKYIGNYDFYIFYNENFLDYPKNSLVFIKNEPKNTERKIVRDNYIIPENIIITDEEELSGKEYIWSKKLSLRKRYEILKNLKSFEKIYAADDIREVL